MNPAICSQLHPLELQKPSVIPTNSTVGTFAKPARSGSVSETSEISEISHIENLRISQVTWCSLGIAERSSGTVDPAQLLLFGPDVLLQRLCRRQSRQVSGTRCKISGFLDLKLGNDMSFIEVYELVSNKMCVFFYRKPLESQGLKSSKPARPPQ